MPEFTVIEGDNQKAFYGLHDAIHEIAIEIMRAVANGRDQKGDLQLAILNLICSWPDKEFDLNRVLQLGIEKLNDDVFCHAHDAADLEINDIVRSSLRLAANRMCHDFAAPARSSRIESGLERDIDRHVSAKEQRRR